MLIDGPATYRQMVDAIDSAVSAEHYIYLLGWILVDDFPLVPGRTFRTLMRDAAGRGVQIRAMLWDQVGRTNTAQVGTINGLSTGAAILDNETLNLGSHHQKVLVVRGGDGLQAFCGGIDVNQDRVATVAGSAGSPLHDVHCKIRGPAAHDLLHTFIQRWDHHPGHTALDRRRGDLLGRREPVPASMSGDTQSVCIARTFNPLHGGPPERDIQRLLVAAIRRARQFIYMEDQYLIHPVAARSLRAALPNIQNLTIVIPGSEISDMPCVWEYRQNFLTLLTGGLPAAEAAKVGVFFPVTRLRPTIVLGAGTYVHSKTWIFDDELAVTGSANCNRRGWDHDSEVNAFVCDDTSRGTSVAQDLRTRLWAKHLGGSPSSYTDALRSAPLWARSVSVAPYNPTAGHAQVPSACPTMLGTVDPMP